MTAYQERVRLCQQICRTIGHHRKNPNLDKLSRVELMLVGSYLNLVGDVINNVKEKGVLPDERTRES